MIVAHAPAATVLDDEKRRGERAVVFPCVPSRGLHCEDTHVKAEERVNR